MSGKKSPLEVPDYVVESLARCILPSIQKYYESEKGQREFEEWKKKRDINKTSEVKAFE
jgi:hypothetical protein